MSLILLREDTSVELLASMGVTKNVQRAIDSGFLLTSATDVDIRKNYHIPARKMLVGVTVRSWLSGQAQVTYEESVARSLDMLVETYDAHVIFIPQVTATKGDDDRITNNRVHDLMNHTGSTTLVDDEPDHHHIKAIYDKLDILLGTRFHSVIFSLTSFVPVVAIEYEHKTSGIMRDLDLSEWVIGIQEVTAPKLQKLLKKLVAEHATYKKELKQKLPPYIAKAQQAAQLMADAYYTGHQGKS